MEQLTVNSHTPAMSEDIRALAKSLRLAKKEFKKTGLSGTNAHQKYDYAKIGDIYEAVEEGLSNHDIIIVHFNRPADTGFEYVHTRLIHDVTGQFIEDCRIQESEKPGNQGKGSANTYMKKYAVLSLCAIATEDDDGQEEQKAIDKKPTGPAVLVKGEVEALLRQLNECANGKILYDNILKNNNIRTLYEFPFSRYEEVKSYIAKNRE